MPCYNNQFFKAEKYIKLLNSDIVAIDGPNTIERLIGNFKIPYAQSIRGRIVLKPGQLAYLMNHLGLGDNATFIAIIATYEKKSVNFEDNFLEFYYFDDTSTIRHMNEVMVLTGNITNRIPQLYFNNPNIHHKVTLDILVANIDDTYTFFPDTSNQTGLSFFNLQCNESICDINTFITNESIVIFDNNTPQNPLVYLTLEEISSINISGQILSIDENTVGKVFLEFISVADTKQAFSLINYVNNNTGIIIQDLSPIIDIVPPIIYFYQHVGNTSSGNYIEFNGATATSYDTSYGITFSTSISLSTYGTHSGTYSTITKNILSNILIADCADNRDGLIYLTASNFLLYYGLTLSESIVNTGTYSLEFNVTDLAGNNITTGTEVILSITS